MYYRYQELMSGEATKEHSTTILHVKSDCLIVCLYNLTLRGLSLFFKLLPISNTGVSIAYILATIHFLYPKLGSFSDMEYYFYQLAYWDSKVPKRFVGLSSALPLLTGTGANKMTPLHAGSSYTQDLGFYSKGNASGTNQNAWAGSLKPQIGWAVKIPPIVLFRPKGGRKTVNIFSHFHGLLPDTNYKHLECFVMLGTHSEPRRGQMSHICDISPLRVKYL